MTMILNFFLYVLPGVCKTLIFIALGSFFNVVVSRNDWYKGRSKCDVCENVLSWYELIPILSFIIQKGRCRHCAAKIDKSHVAAEFFSMLGGIVFSLYSFDFVVLVTLFVLMFNAIMDYKTGMVDTLVTYTGIFLIAVYKICECFHSGIFNYLALMAITAFVLYVLAKIFKNYIGGGDFDIIFLLVLSMGHFEFARCLFYAGLIGTVYAFFRRLDRKTQIPFVPLFYLGYLVILLLRFFNMLTLGGC